MTIKRDSTKEINNFKEINNISKDNTADNLDLLNKVISEVFSDFISKQKIPKNKPLSVNIQFSADESMDELYEDIDSLVTTSSHLFLTFFTPYNLHELRFDVDDSKSLIMIKSNNLSFYKEFHFHIPIKKDTMETTFKNNVLEVKIDLK